MEFEEAKRVLGMIAGRESGITTVTLNRDAARVVLDHLAAQGEPSDAALRLAERAWMAAYRQEPRERLRAALRAASAVTKQGENR